MKPAGGARPMIAAVLLACVVGACSGGTQQQAKPVTTTAPPVKPTVATASRTITAQQFCERFAVLKERGCPAFKNIQMDRDSCIGEMGRAEDWAQDFLKSYGPCLVDRDDCDDVAECIKQQAEPKLNNLRACDHHDVERAVGVPPAEWAKRKGADITRFADARSTKALPIEVCGVPAENVWLVQAVCNDGSHPFGTNADAEGARVGNVGEGGRCGAIIDQYKVKCPEATYEIYLDGYVCPLPQ